jgi:hypothetical protein
MLPAYYFYFEQNNNQKFPVGNSYSIHYNDFIYRRGILS